MSNTNDILKKEEEILKREEKILAEVKKDKAAARRAMFTSVAAAALVLAAIGGVAFWRYGAQRVSIDKSAVEAPRIDIGPAAPGTLQETYVRVGDTVSADAVVARVGAQLLKTKSPGVVVAVSGDIGSQVNPGTAVVSLVNPADLRVVGAIDEDKGLADVRVGDRATFTVDAFGGRQFVGTVDEVSPISHDAGVVFSISDKREVRTFDVKVRFDAARYPELKNGMSAKITVLKD